MDPSLLDRTGLPSSEGARHTIRLLFLATWFLFGSYLDMESRFPYSPYNNHYHDAY